MKKLFELWDALCTKGLKFPYAFDPITSKPSITLLFPYLALLMLVPSLILLHFKPGVLAGTIATFMFWVVATIFYMIRKLHKAEIDLDDNSISLESDKDEDEEVEYVIEEDEKK